MRGLVMDFGADRKAWDIDDQYMFGPAFLVAPVTEFKARQRERLSACRDASGTTSYDRPQPQGRPDRHGRRRRTSACPCSSAPDRSCPTGPAIQHTERAARWADSRCTSTPGADGSFSLYEDDGVSRQYLNGAFARIPVTYDEASRTLTIGAREGSYPGMAAKRSIHIRWISPERARPLAFEGADRTVAYDGSEQTVRMP